MAKRPTIIRFFSDHAESPLWFEGSIDPEQLGLDDDFCRRLRAWAHYSTYDLVPDSPRETSWKSGADVAGYEAAGLAMAAELSRILGHSFLVEYHPLESSPAKPARFRSRHEALDLKAEVAALALVRDDD